MNVKKIAAAIPHETRRKILLEWIPAAKANMSNPEFQMLWAAYFTYVDPNAIPKDDCAVCRQNVLDNWKGMQEYLIEAEQEYESLEKL